MRLFREDFFISVVQSYDFEPCGKYSVGDMACARPTYTLLGAKEICLLDLHPGAFDVEIHLSLGKLH